MKWQLQGNQTQTKSNILAISLICLLSSCWDKAEAVVRPTYINVSFPRPHYVNQQVTFWESIFDRYTTDMEIIHDVMYPAMIIDVIDFHLFARKYQGGSKYSKRARKSIAERYVKRYELAIKRIQKERRGALRYGAMEKRVFYVYSREKDALNSLYKGLTQLRTQTGLKDEFQEAVRRGSKFIPHMEDIFRHHRLPIELTRIAFVESMFNVDAKSKVGASGIWQFMPRTGRQFMKVNSWIDERNSPLKATEAAAKLLKNNMKALGSWPLAITAYNHGAGGLLRAIKTHRTKDIGVIAKNFRSRTFGFASRNFYAEFLAAKNVFNRRYRHQVDHQTAAAITKVNIQKKMTISELLRKTPLTYPVLKKYNRCITDQGMRRYTNRPLPQNFKIFVPEQMAQQVSDFVTTNLNQRTL